MTELIVEQQIQFKRNIILSKLDDLRRDIKLTYSKNNGRLTDMQTYLLVLYKRELNLLCK